MSTTIHIPSPAAARILNNLIQYGYAPRQPPDLPPAWQAPFEAVQRIRNHDRRTRLDAFKAALEGHPHAYEMLQEVLKLSDTITHRADPHRLLYSAQDALADPPRVQWCVPDFFALPSFNLLVGAPGAKKTLLAIDLAVSVAAGRPWFGRPVPPASVLFIDEDTGLQRLWGRLNAALRAHAASSDTPLHFLSLGGYDLRLPEDAEALTNRALSVDARLIVIDALPNLMRGATENNLAAVQPVLFHLRRMAEHCRAAVLAVHHTNKRGVFRGHSSISAAADLMLAIETSPNSATLTLRTLKARFHAPDPLTARIHFDTTSGGRSLTRFTLTDEIPDSTAPPVPVNTQQGVALEVMQYLSDRESATTRQLTKHLSQFKRGSIQNTLHQLIQSGHIQRINSGRRGKPALYALTSPKETS